MVRDAANENTRPTTITSKRKEKSSFWLKYVILSYKHNVNMTLISCGVYDVYFETLVAFISPYIVH